MITKMKSILVLGLGKQKDDILHDLSHTGIVHVKHTRPPEGPLIEELNINIRKALDALSLLPEGGEPVHDNKDGMVIIQRLFGLGEKQYSLNDELGQLQHEAEKISYLGDFFPEDIRHLESRNIKIQLYRLRKKQVTEIPSDIACSIIAELKASVIIASFSLGEEKELSYIKESIPPRSIGQVNKRIEKIKAELDIIEKEIKNLAGYRNKIERIIEEKNNQKKIQKAIYGMGSDGEVTFLKGFCPEPEIEILKKAAEKKAFGLIVKDPDPDEEPPTLLKNPKWIDLIKPVFNIINSLPGYREFDISGWFLLFFSVFFALLIGDAGYGLFFVGITGFSHYLLKNKTPARSPFYLMYILSTCSIIWGAVTGNWLGIEAVSEIPPFNKLIIPSLNAYKEISQATMMNLCFIIGAIQLTTGHLIVFFRYINRFKALAQTGWISLVWSVFFLARNLVLGSPIPWFFNHLLISGIALVVIFTNPQKNILKGMLSGIADLPMTAINTFADNMSYIRLFAVGTATLAVAQSFNNIGLEVGYGNILNGFLATLILVFGHSLNIILAAMAVIVHGVRLNMLEFSGHVGNTWSGFEYKPLKIEYKKEI